MKGKSVLQWVSRRSELSGFDKAYYCTDSRGDYIRVDVNPAAGRAMLIVEDRSEKRYASLIEKGSIVWEKVGDTPSSGVAAKMRGKSRLFSMAPSDAHRIIRGFYGITSPGSSRKRKVRDKGYRGVLIVSAVLLAVCVLILFLSFR